MRKSLPIFYSALLLTAVNLLLRFVSTSFQVYISSRIGAEGVGLLQLVLSVGGLALTAGMAGARTATMYLTAEELGRRKPENITWVLRGCLLYTLICSVIVASGVYIAAPYLAAYWVGNPYTCNAIRLYATILPLICLTGCLTGYFTAANRITTLAGIEIAEQACYMLVTMTILSVWAKNNAERACVAVVFGSGISSALTLLCLIILRNKENSPTGIKIPIAKRICTAALPLAAADDVKAAISTTENLMVPKRLALCSSEATPLAAFGTVVGMVFPILMFPAAILYALAELIIPELARCNASGKHIRIQYLVIKCLRVALLYGCLCSGILYLSAETLCVKIYRSVDAGQHLKLYSMLAPMLYCDAIIDAMVKGLGQQTANVRYNIFTSAMDVAFLFILLPKFGMMGYFISFLITHLINLTLSLRRLLNVSKVSIRFYHPILTVSAMIIAVWCVQKFHLLAGIPAFLFLYLLFLSLFRVVDHRDVEWLKDLIKKSDPR